MKIAVVRERAAGETRVAATPETVGKLIALGATVSIEGGAGELARMPDADYEKSGATIAADAAAAVQGADVLLTVRRPEPAVLRGLNPGALVIGGMDPYGNEGAVHALAETGATLVAMEFMPRITRAQVMDILSSQANLAGYQAVIDSASAFDRAFPMMMTAAGTVRPAKVFVMGAGVAGLQAIATARRLGAVVSANDVRPAAKEQVESLGGKFIAVEDDEFKQAETAGGYAKQMSAEYQAKQAALTASHIAKQDIVITTALIPGRPAPRLISREMVESMPPGSVIVDLAAERGGNCELTKPGEVIQHGGVTIVGYTNVPGRLATSASQLYARNLLAFVETLIDKSTKTLAVNWDDELVRATVLTRNGGIVHPNIRFDPAAAMPTATAAAAAAPATVVPAAAPIASAEPPPPVASAAPETSAPRKRAAKTAASVEPVPPEEVKGNAPARAPRAKTGATPAKPAKGGAAAKDTGIKPPAEAGSRRRAPKSSTPEGSE